MQLYKQFTIEGKTNKLPRNSILNIHLFYSSKDFFKTVNKTHREIRNVLWVWYIAIGTLHGIWNRRNLLMKSLHIRLRNLLLLLGSRSMENSKLLFIAMLAMIVLFVRAANVSIWNVSRSSVFRLPIGYESVSSGMELHRGQVRVLHIHCIYTVGYTWKFRPKGYPFQAGRESYHPFKTWSNRRT